MIKNFVKILELLGDRLEVCVSVVQQPRLYSKTCVKQPLQNRQNKDLNDQR